MAKIKIPTGKSAIRQAILAILQKGSKSLGVDTSNVTKTHIEKYLGDLPVKFTPARLKSGAKFIRAIRDKSKVDGKLLFPDGQKKDALTDFAQALDEGGVAYKASVSYRSPQSKYQRKADTAMKKAKKDIKGKVMGNISELYVVIVKSDNKERVLGGFANASSARASAKAYIRGIKKAYDPLIAEVITGTTKTGRTSNRQAKLKVESRNYTKRDDGIRGGEATYKFEAGKALDYLRKHLGKTNLIVKAIKVRDRKDHRAYWKLFDSPSVGQIRWNPKRIK
jgi:hypothetical protein